MDSSDSESGQISRGGLRDVFRFVVIGVSGLSYFVYMTPLTLGPGRLFHLMVKANYTYYRLLVILL